MAKPRDVNNLSRQAMSSPESTLLVLSLVSEHITASFVAELRKQDAAPLSNEPSHVWRLKNRYYEAKVSIATAYDLSTALGQLQGVPALIVLSDYDAKPLIISRLLSSIAAYQMPDIAILALVKGHTNRDGDAVEAEWLDVAVEQGFELVDLEHAPETGDDGRDMTSYAYLASTLQTHLWPRVGATAPTGFDDDFSDFVSAEPKGDNDMPSSAELEEMQRRIFGGKSSMMSSDGEGEEEGDLAALMTRLTLLKQEASAMPDEESRRRFAERVALSFALGIDDAAQAGNAST